MTSSEIISLCEENLRLQEELSSKRKDLSKVTIPYVKSKRILMQEGVHNTWYYSEAQLKNSRLEDSYGLFFDHNDGTSTQVGAIENAHWADDGEKGPGIYGDVVVLDLPVAQKLEYGIKWGLSPTIDIDKNYSPDGAQIASDPVFLSWSVVLKPAVRATMLNNQNEGENMVSEEVMRLAEQLAKKKIDDKNEEIKKKIEEEKKKNKDLSARLEKIENDKIDTDSNKLLKMELSIGRTKEPIKGDRLIELKKLSFSERKLLEDSYAWMVTALELDADEKPEKYLNVEGLSEEDLSAFTDFVKSFIKKHKGAKIADAAKAYKKEKAKGLSANPPALPAAPMDKKKKKYPYPPDNLSENIPNDERQDLSDNRFDDSKQFLSFLKQNQEA
jgi:hypothetical protein